MTQIAFLKKAELPTNQQIQDTVQKLGYYFKILSSLENQIDQNGLECSINGHKTYFETYVDTADNTLMSNEAEWLKSEITNQNIAIAFVWGADFAAGACVGLISLALIDISNALVYYMDEQMKYTREMLLADTPQFLEELNKQSNRNVSHQESMKPGKTNKPSEKNFWDRLKNIF